MSTTTGAAAYEAITAQLAEWGDDGDGDGDGFEDDGEEAGLGGGDVAMAEAEAMRSGVTTAGSSSGGAHPRPSFPSSDAAAARMAGSSASAPFGAGFSSPGAGGIFAGTPAPAPAPPGNDYRYDSGGRRRRGGGDYSSPPGGTDDGAVGGEEGGELIPFFAPPPSSGRATAPASGTTGGGSREFVSNMAYHDAMRTYLVRRSAVLGRIDLLNEGEDDGEDDVVLAAEEAKRHRSELLEEYRTAQVDLLRSFFDAAATRDRGESSSSSDVRRGGGSGQARDNDWSDAEREANVWDLLRRLLSRGTDRRTGEASLLYDPPSPGSAAVEWDPDEVVEPLDSFPAQLVRRVMSVQPAWDDGGGGGGGDANAAIDGNYDPCDTPEFVLQRRKAMVEWLESCFARHHRLDQPGGGGGGGGSIGAWIVPPKERNVMWPKTISKTRGRKPVELDPDAPLRASASASALAVGRRAAASTRLLDPRDEEDDAELLRAVVLLFMCGNPEMACDVCVSAGQSWRAASMRGGEPYGVALPPPDQDDEDEDGAGATIRRVGNPRRAAWKVQCRLLGGRLAEESSRAADGTRREAGRPYHPSVYESAVYALLSHDVPTAMDNPALFPAAPGGGGSSSPSSWSASSSSSSSSWEVGMWIHLRASVERSVDDLLAMQAAMRREVGRRLPYPGCSASDDDCVVSPAGVDDDDASPVDEGSIVDAVAAHASSDPYRLAASCFVEGTGRVREYLFEYVRRRCRRRRAAADDDDVDAAGDDDDGEFLRFASHLILFLVLTYPNEVGMGPGNDHDGGIDDDGDGDGGGATSVMVDVVRAYVDRDLVRRRHLPLVSLYASLLPRGDLVETYVDFLVDVEDDDERRLVLDRAREDFVEGLDLVILRRVVERILDGDTGGDGDGSGSGGGLVRVGTRDVGGGGGGGGIAVDVEVSPSDLRKLAAIRWMCYHPEHHLDALLYANALLRGLLLSAPPTSASRGSTVAATPPPPGAGSKVSAGKLLVTRFLPPDTVDVVRDFVASSSSEGTPTAEEAEDAIAEHVAMCLYLDAHTAYEEWRNTMATCEQNMPPAAQPPPSGAAGAEADIARARELRDHRRRLRSLGRAALRATVTAEEKLSAVLRHRPGGWLGGGGGPHPPTPRPREEDDGDSSSWDGHRRRGDEMLALRSSCLPHSVFMLHAVLDGMASWAAGIGHEGGGDDEEGGGLFDEEVSAGVSESMFEPAHWHRKALAMADLVASDEYGLHDVMNGDEIGSFLGRLAESGVKLLRCGGGGGDDAASSAVLAS